MSLKRLSLVVAVSLLVVSSAEAQKRRAVRSAPPSAVGTDCHTFTTVRPGLIADYRAVAPGGTVTFTITYISDTPTQRKTTQRVVTPQATTEVETIVDGETVGDMAAIKHINTKGNIISPIRTSLEVDITFAPSLITGPANEFCVGRTWVTNPVTETIVTKTAAGNFSNIVTTVGTEGEVLAVDEVLTVTAGTFRTVKYRGAIVSDDDVSPAITWVSMEHNVVVRQDTLDAQGNVTSTLEATRIQ